MSVSNESDDDDDKVILKEESSCADEADNRINLGENGKLKKGPWTPDEDAILIEYVTKNGEGNWNAVQKNSGLARCGKSCRLRWANHLRPDLKKGAFTQEEENRVVELHAKMGNKWARMTNELPGRTDNEIKNFWNTRIKRRQRHGLPIYPDDIFSESTNEKQEIDDMNGFSSGENTHNHLNIKDPVDTIDIPEFKTESFKRMKQYIPSQLNSMLDIPTSSLLPPQALHPSSYLRKRFRVLESFCPGLNPNIVNTGRPLQISQPFTFSSVLDENSTSSVFSTNPPAWPMKPEELPSLQTQMGNNWITPPSYQLPPLESVDTLPPLESADIFPPRNNNLFDARGFYGSNMKKTNNDFTQQVSHASDMVVCDVFDTSSQDIHETEWDQLDEPLSPSSPIFSDGTPISGTSFDELQSAKIFPGYKVQEARRLVPVKYDYKAETGNMMNFYKPRTLRDSDCFGSSDPTKDNHYWLKDTIGEMFLDD